MSDNPFTTPSDNPSPDDIDIEAATPGGLTRVAGFALLVAGLFNAAGGFQAFMLFFFDGLYFINPILDLFARGLVTVLGLLGLAAIPMGGGYFNASRWAVPSGGVASIILSLVSIGWSITATVCGLILPLTAFAAGFAMLATLVVGVSFQSAWATAKAKATLFTD